MARGAPAGEIRNARSGEALDLAELWMRSRAAAAPAIPPPIHGPEEIRGWFVDVVLPTREVWVADVDGTAVGVLVLHGDWVDQLYVDVGSTGRGIGGQLITHAKRQRPEKLQLWVFQSNAGARRFYERHGFVAMERTDGDNEERAPDVRYEWPAPAPD